MGKATCRSCEAKCAGVDLSAAVYRVRVAAGGLDSAVALGDVDRRGEEPADEQFELCDDLTERLDLASRPYPVGDLPFI